MKIGKKDGKCCTLLTDSGKESTSFSERKKRIEFYNGKQCLLVIKVCIVFDRWKQKLVVSTVT